MFVFVCFCLFVCLLVFVCLFVFVCSFACFCWLVCLLAYCCCFVCFLFLFVCLLACFWFAFLFLFVCLLVVICLTLTPATNKSVDMCLRFSLCKIISHFALVELRVWTRRRIQDENYEGPGNVVDVCVTLDRRSRGQGRVH